MEEEQFDDSPVQSHSLDSASEDQDLESALAKFGAETLAVATDVRDR